MSQDYIALEWVKGEVEETLQQAQQALESYVDNPQDKSLLKFCLSYLHQVHGTLVMVEFYGAALLAEEMEAVAQALVNEKAREQDSLQVLMQAIIQLPNYLEHIKVGRRDLPVLLLPLLNQLRGARNEDLLSETALLTPGTVAKPPLNEQQMEAYDSEDFLLWVKKLRKMLQTALLQLFQDNQADLAKQYLIKIFARLHKALGETPQGMVWLPALAFCESLKEQGTVTVAIKQLFGQLDRLLKNTAVQGSRAVGQPPDDDVIKNLLFYISKSGIDSEATRSVKKMFGLLTDLEVKEEAHQLSGPDKDTVEHVLSALVEEITIIKDRMDLLIRGNGDRAHELQEIVEALKHISDTMAVLGLGMPRKVLQEQEGIITRLLQENANITDERLMDVAGALLYVEATLSGMKREGDLTVSAGQSALSDAQRAVLREARNVLEQVKDAVVEYISKQWSTDELLNVPSLLHTIEGSLGMIPLPDVASILSRVAAFVQQQLIHQKIKPQWSDLDHLADVLSSVEYFLERYSEKPESNPGCIEKAETSLGKLLQANQEAENNVLADADEEVSGEDDPGFADSLGIEAVQPFVSASEHIEVEHISTDKDSSRYNMAGNPAEADIQISSQQGSDKNDALELIQSVDTASETLAPETSQEDTDDDNLIDDEIIEIFLEEAGEVSGTLDEFWPKYKTDHSDQDALTTVRRAFHTLKGSGRMVQAEIIGELAWSIENVFNRVLDGTVQAGDNLIALVDHVISILPVLIDDFRHRLTSSADVKPLQDYADALADNREVQSFEAPPQAGDTVNAGEEGSSGKEQEDDALVEVFVAEARSHLGVIDEFISNSTEEDYFNPLTDQLQRALHTLKGSAFMAGIKAIGQIASPLEHLIKELRAYQVDNRAEVVSALQDGSQLIRKGLAVKPLQGLEAIADGEEFPERVTHLEEWLLEPFRLEQQHSTAVNPQNIASFLELGMGSLMDADRLLQQWQISRDYAVLHPLCTELKRVEKGAGRSELSHIETLAAAIESLYQRILREQITASDDLLALLEGAHEALLGMMDCLAAGIETQAADEVIHNLQQWTTQADKASPDPMLPETSTPDIQAAINDQAGNLIAEPDSSFYGANDTGSIPSVEVDEVGASDEILDIFLEEAAEISEAIDMAMQRWREEPSNLLQIAQLQRELHTLKGGARMAELVDIADLCHELETLYEKMSEGQLSHSNDLFYLLQKSHDALDDQLDAVRRGESAARSSDLIGELHACLQDTGMPGNIEHTVDIAPPGATLDESDREVLEIFIEEAQELQESLDRALHQWEQSPQDMSCAAEAQRVLHTLKGGARLSGLGDIGNQAHELEASILQAQQGQIEVTGELFSRYYHEQDSLTQKIEAVSAGLEGGGYISLGDSMLNDMPEVIQPDNVQDGQVLNHQDTEDQVVGSNVVPIRRDTSSNSAAASPEAVAARKASPQELVKVPANLLDSLVNLAGETSIGRGRLEQQVTDFSYTLGEMDMTLDRLRDQLRRLDMETEAQVLFRQERQGPQYDDFDPLEMDRYSAMQQLSRALVESASDLLDLKDTLSNKTRDTETLLLQQSRVNTELQEGLMKTRMVPFQRLVPRLRRIVRQISLELDKQVELQVYNADGEMDRTVLERLVSPLEHMVRNAVDHGLETEDQRIAEGKPVTGRVELDIARDGSDIILTLRDDGRGVNIEAVRRKAIERGLMDEGADLNDEDIVQFILQAGFSTAEKVTQISGRGVGMDVVSSEIKQMGGTVNIRSVSGKGSEFIIRLPFTVSVNRALMVRAGDDLYAIPLNNIQGIVRAAPSELQMLYSRPAVERTYSYNNDSYRLEYLGHLLGIEDQPRLAGYTQPLPLLLLGGNMPFALQVDALLGSREIVVKTLGPQFSTVMGVSGGTILGDGSVVIILDLPAMIRAQSSTEYQQAKALDFQDAERRHELEARLPRILVVDDSVTVRKVTTRLLERNGMEVFTAQDGVDAMSTLQDHKPDLILLDIEMPRMDGFEVAAQVRHDSHLQDIPIIMITSRTGDKHRERAMSLGVNEYLGKPFQEDKLLSTMNKLLGRKEV